jgi:branched-chain amino acid transport system ATP-binding protein
MLTLTNLSTEYDRVPMLRSINLDIPEGHLVCLLGSNGAGKTTTVKTILGLVKPTGGEIRFQGASLSGAKTNQRISHGIAVVPEGRRLFPKMTVGENLRLGAFFVKNRHEIDERMEKVFLLFPQLKSRITQTAGTLSGGEQSMAAIGRGMMSRPKLLLLDEPSLGLSPKLVQEYFETIQRINREEKTTILLIEQNASKAIEISHSGYVLQKGSIIAQGSRRDLMDSDVVKKAYLAMDQEG